jgi:hypothetical protein
MRQIRILTLAAAAGVDVKAVETWLAEHAPELVELHASEFVDVDLAERAAAAFAPAREP